MDCRLMSMLIKLNGHSSYRNTVDTANDFLVRTGEMTLAYKTTSDLIIRLGMSADKAIDNMCSSILEGSGFDATTVLPVDVAQLPVFYRLLVCLFLFLKSSSERVLGNYRVLYKSAGIAHQIIV